MDFKGQCETEIHYEKHKIEQKKGREIFHLNQKSIQSRLIIYWQFFYLDLRLQDDYDHVHDQQND